ncbi:unnamed protein product [Prorocentrum cordatum]|uniref:Glycosyltransferase 2-like domain-containing protein n=1 Tax=Prorocentrum cordatum TaxID=2364126 RepID=A0ABN9XDW8_9DINO|nr:unnamed protein product [Polarella glacialis]
MPLPQGREACAGARAAAPGEAGAEERAGGAEAPPEEESGGGADCGGPAAAGEWPSPLLRPLVREWQSACLGHVVVEAVPDEGGAGGVVVLRASFCGPVDPMGPLGQLTVEGGFVRLEIWRPRRQRGVLWLDVQESKGRRVAWLDGSGRSADCWDGCLLDTVRKAARWVEESPHRLTTWLDEGLSHLRGDTEVTTSQFTVGLCITSMNRLWQLRRALPLNLLQCWPHRQWVRIHVVDFGSSDGTMDFLLNRCRVAMDCDLLRVYRADLEFWHASVAKNTAHAVADEDILVNCDGDNLLGPGFPQDVVLRLTTGSTGLQYEGGLGTCGRIACWRSDFDKIRGYDEDCYPMGAQDIDLRDRLEALPNANFQRVNSTKYCQAIPNSQEDKIVNCAPLYGQVRWGRMDTINRRMFKWRLQGGQVVRNLHKDQIGVPAIRMSPLGPQAVRRGLPGCSASAVD